MASAIACIQGSTLVPPPLATMRRGVDAGQVEHVADDEPARLVGGPLQAARRRR